MDPLKIIEDFKKKVYSDQDSSKEEKPTFEKNLGIYSMGIRWFIYHNKISRGLVMLSYFF